MDVLVLYVSLEHAGKLDELARFVSASFPGAVLVGGTSASLLAGDREWEDGATMAVVAGHLGAGVSAESLHIPDENAGERALRAVDWDGVRGALMVSDPFSADVDRDLRTLERIAPSVPVVGGILAGGTSAGAHRLWTEHGVYEGGSVMLLFRGAVELVPVVSQGVVPMGEPVIVMQRRGHVIDAFDQGNPLAFLQSLLAEYPRAEREKINRALVLGVGVESARVDEGTDFVLGEIIGVDPKTGSLAVAAMIEDYQVVRFMRRDPEYAREDLSRQLLLAGSSRSGRTVRAAFSFVSGERGMQFFRRPDHDAGAISELVEGGAHVGVFCGSEVGPVGGRALVQSFSACAALLVER